MNDASTQCLHDMFALHADAAPDAIAAVAGDRSITYGQLRERSRRLAAVLRAQHVGPDVVVGLHVPRSIDMLVGILGILEAGAAYLPLWVGHPAERLRFMLDHSGARVLVESDATRGGLPEFDGIRIPVDARPDAVPAEAGPRATPDHLAYVIYTSGTTGTPKGVAVPHRAAARIVRSGIYGTFDAGQTFLQSCPLSFDASVFEIFGCLANGGRLAILPDQRVSAELIVETVRHAGVTTLWLTPTLFNRIVDDGLLDGAGLHQVVVGGEVLSSAHVAHGLGSLGARIANGYGPTEAGVFTCCHQFAAADLAQSPPPVGRPLPGTEVHILDERLRPVPDGEQGELYIGGDALARGYHNRPDLTAAAFVPDPVGARPGARLYRSGDLARMLPGGLVQVLGRTDDQVKIRGNRVELGEVESALAELPEIRQAAVVDRTQGGDRVLAAYVVPAAGAPTVAELRRRLAARLPDYMIPSEYHRVEALPLTQHGKLDRAALRADTDAARLDLGSRYAAAGSELETVIAALWAELLEVPTVGIDDNYFDLGGTSASVPALNRRIHQELGARLSVTALYEYPTVRSLAESIASAGVRG
ncbi:non-ribosomal peptide synthetase [Micromonospora eburnea]|uniref:Amino acid adenylation domain-containing protein n=1 Tax=Micromonospora eburnea TaxID=227316 RepID=A0A1C6UV71_9ACTN|nr:non-ribosomal peptide synthetase [Micromonospora eburnea]SCL57947.1 amino acid adenylation domain-containing protein [Micromonospora eburnea]